MPDLTAMTLSEMLAFVGGAVIGEGTALWCCIEGKTLTQDKNAFIASLTSVFLVLLTVASCWKGNGSSFFKYHKEARWLGPWDSPNTFGILMGTGIVLVLGLGAVRGRTEAVAFRRWIFIFLKLGVLVFTGRALLHSYSRGAWAGTAAGLVYLACQIVRRKSETKAVWISWLGKKWRLAGVILLGAIALVFWHFREMDWPTARRIFSSMNTVDFSWRNRVAAWEGTLQIAIEHPWFGAGWNQPELVYQNYYMPAQIIEPTAIGTNDYLKLAVILGVPATFCFGMYLGLSLIKNEKLKMKNEEATAGEWSRMTCRAGTMGLLVGFWFDGGLFELPTAAVFWILLELGSAGRISQENGEITEKIW